MLKLAARSCASRKTTHTFGTPTQRQETGSVPAASHREMAPRRQPQPAPSTPARGIAAKLKRGGIGWDSAGLRRVLRTPARLTPNRPPPTFTRSKKLRKDGGLEAPMVDGRGSGCRAGGAPMSRAGAGLRPRAPGMWLARERSARLACGATAAGLPASPPRGGGERHGPCTTPRWHRGFRGRRREERAR